MILIAQRRNPTTLTWAVGKNDGRSVSDVFLVVFFTYSVQLTPLACGWFVCCDDRNNKSGRKVIKERHRGTEEEVTRDLYHGMEPEQREEFESDWRSVGGVHGGARLSNGGGRVSNAPRLGNEFGGS